MSELAAALADAMALGVEQRRNLAEAERALLGVRAQVVAEQARSEGTEQRLAQLRVEAGERELILQEKLRETILRFDTHHRGCEGEAPKADDDELAAIKASASWRIGNRLVRLAKTAPGVLVLGRAYRWKIARQRHNISS